MAMRKKKEPLNNAERVAAHRARVEAEGGKQIAVMLSGGAVAKLEAIKAKTGASVTDIINNLLLRQRP